MRDDPIDFLKTIKKLIHDPVHACYLYASLTDSMERLTSCKQGENEGLFTYTKRFKKVREIIKSSVGEEFLHTFVETIEEYEKEQDYTKKGSLKTKSFATWTTYVYINNKEDTRRG